MEFTMQNKAPNLLPSKLLVMAKANRDVIFNTANLSVDQSSP